MILGFCKAWEDEKYAVVNMGFDTVDMVCILAGYIVAFPAICCISVPALVFVGQGLLVYKISDNNLLDIITYSLKNIIKFSINARDGT